MQRRPVDKRRKTPDTATVQDAADAENFTVRLGAAVKRELGGRPQRWLAGELGMDTGHLSRLLSGQIGSIAVEQVVVLEAALELPAGYLFRVTGLVPAAEGVVEAVMADPVLDLRSKAIVLATYRGAMDEVGAR